MRAVLAALLLALSPVLAFAATVADGQLAYDGGRFAEAREIWTDLAAGGDAAAEYRLGTLYDLGSGVTPDPVAAHCWYRRAAESGLPAAAFNVAVMHDSGRGAAADPVEAARWYARAAAAGFGRAEFNLGQLYDAGEGVPRNPGLAATWYRAAAQDGVPEAANRQPARLALPADAAPGKMALDAPDRSAPDGQQVAAVPLTWAAPPQPPGASFYVEVVALGGGAPRAVFTGDTDRSAVVAKLPPGRYAARVFTVAAAQGHYAAGDWTRFTVGVRAGESATLVSCQTPCPGACSPPAP